MPCTRSATAIETLHVRHGLRGAESEDDAAACRALGRRARHAASRGRRARGPRAGRRGARARAQARRGRRACAPAARSRRGTRATTASRRSSIAWPRRRAARRSPRCPPPTATAASGRCSSSGATRCAPRLRAPASRGGTTARTRIARFARNRVRLDLLPAFRSLHPSAEANLLRTAALLAEDDAALDAIAAGLLADGGALATAAVAVAPPAVVRRALRRVAGFPAPRPVAAERVAALARSRSGSGTVPLGAGRYAERRYDRIAIVARPVARGARARGRARGPGRHAPTARRSCAARSARRTVRSRPRSRALADAAPGARGRAAARRAPDDRADAARGACAPQRARSLPCRDRARRAGRASRHRRGPCTAPTVWSRAHDHPT